jgi:regulator of replication initiation timing
MSWIYGETGLSLEAIEKIKAWIKRLEEENTRLREENEKLGQKIADIEAVLSG